MPPTTGLRDAQAELRALGLHLEVGLDLDAHRLGAATPAAAGGAAAANPQLHTGAPGPTLLQQLGLEGVPTLSNGGVGAHGVGALEEEGKKEDEVQRRGAGWRALVELARGAALVVTGEAPGWARRLGVSVDCRLPSPCVLLDVMLSSAAPRPSPPLHASPFAALPCVLPSLQHTWA